MAKVKLSAGAEVDFLNSTELEKHLSMHHRSWFVEMARGVKLMRLPLLQGTISGGDLTLPVPGEGGVGPSEGFVWAIQRISCTGLSTNDVLGIYRNQVDPTTFIGQITAAVPWFHVGSCGFLLKGGDTLMLAATGLSATGTLSVNGEYKEVPETQAWKLL